MIKTTYGIIAIIAMLINVSIIYYLYENGHLIIGVVATLLTVIIVNKNVKQ